jgi:hypothetical protein
MVGQARILWERLMTLVYYLEEGQDPRGKSIRKVFFPKIPSWGGRWDILAEWESEIDWYDRLYRTPEFHTRSTLRKDLFETQLTDPNLVMAPIQPMHGFWQVFIAAVRGVQSPIVRLGRMIHPETTLKD